MDIDSKLLNKIDLKLSLEDNIIMWCDLLIISISFTLYRYKSRDITFVGIFLLCDLYLCSTNLITVWKKYKVTKLVVY